MININRRGERWQVNFRYRCPHTDTKQHFRRCAPLGFTKRQAQRWGMREWEAAHDPTPRRDEAPLFSDFCATYMDRAPGFLAGSTVKARGYQIEAFLKPHFGAMRLDEIGAMQSDAFVAKRMESVGPARAARDVAILSSMLGKAAGWGLIESRPKLPKPREPEVAWRWLDEAEIARFVEGSRGEPMLRNLVKFAFNTGLRTGEFAELRWSDVDLEAKTLTVARSFTRGAVGPTKGRKVRALPLNVAALEALEAQRRETWMRGGLVFCCAEGRRVTKARIRGPWGARDQGERGGAPDPPRHAPHLRLAARAARRGAARGQGAARPLEHPDHDEVRPPRAVRSVGGGGRPRRSRRVGCARAVHGRLVRLTVARDLRGLKPARLRVMREGGLEPPHPTGTRT